MAQRHYGYDVKVVRVGSTEVQAVYESIDISDDSIVKETQSAQDSGPNKRIFSSDFSVSLSKFVQGNADWLYTYLKANRNNVNLVFILSEPNDVAGGGTTFKTFTMNGCVCTKLGLNLSGDGTKESYEFSRGSGGDYTIV